MPLRTAYQHALLRNRTDAARLLAELGASTAVAPEDEAVPRWPAASGPNPPLPDELAPDPQEVLILAALRGQLGAVIQAVAAVRRRGGRLTGGQPSCTTRRGSATPGW